MVTVAGQLCTPKDVLARQVRSGDLLLFSLAGAYAWNIPHQQFLSHPAPQMVFLPVKREERAQRGNVARQALR
ncbi:hypothetical protein GCM10008955_22560 [Deinococcus malanensis]|uniref:Orn/DAP/Arg decarboxylase 2 C-terminal domain-containing protein n=1 Tax=Deinococcus malanensis TaxID=1706855 RepID=A0ABQ2EWG7_9DEIO|nr:hypothetical protein [Deinococcus malanensis]GGK28299.1 hypothetical protein GCM10008955_22560 [Deinococcus malanensis]